MWLIAKARTGETLCLGLSLKLTILFHTSTVSARQTIIASHNNIMAISPEYYKSLSIMSETLIAFELQVAGSNYQGRMVATMLPPSASEGIELVLSKMSNWQ